MALSMPDARGVPANKFMHGLDKDKCNFLEHVAWVTSYKRGLGTAVRHYRPTARGGVSHLPYKRVDNVELAIRHDT